MLYFLAVAFLYAIFGLLLHSASAFLPNLSSPSVRPLTTVVDRHRTAHDRKIVTLTDKLNMASREFDLSTDRAETNNHGLQRLVSLASSYRVEISSDQSTETWSLVSLAEVDGDTEEERAKTALLNTAEFSSSNNDFTLRCTRNGDSLVVVSDPNVDSSLAASLSRIMVQRLASRQDNATNKSWSISLPEEKPVAIQNLLSEAGVLELFRPILDRPQVELVEMVDRDGAPLAMIPRPLVHTYNLLHRGIGMVVAKDAPIVCSGMSSFPDLYVHRRTDSKRIFPSLYDMFVGGVSSAGEDAKTTAQREVAEELGLSRALTDTTALSEPLFKCTVCTSYNRCVVTVFCFTFDSSQDKIAWQEEEVAWGSFVPYSVIESSASLCVKQMVSSKSWPGASPDALLFEDRDSISDDNYGMGDEWKTWDYVPDGLLVWESWVRWQKGKKP